MVQTINTLLYCLKSQLGDIVQPFFVGRHYFVGSKAVSDNTLWICIKEHTSSGEIFIGNHEYWELGVQLQLKKAKAKKG